MNVISKIIISILVTILFHPSSLSSLGKEQPKSFVTSPLWGQLGNQLFQAATALAYGWDHNVDAIFPDLFRTTYNIPLNREKIFFRLNASPLPRKIRNSFQGPEQFQYVAIPVKKDLNLLGLFSHWRYFDHHRKEILNIFAPAPLELAYLKSKHALLLAHPFTVGVHVRTLNKEWSKIIPFVGLDYYEKAMNYFPPEALFVVFSDRIDWCKKHFQKLNRPMIFIEGQDHVDDLFLMSMMKHNIIGTSTFSWWGAYLNQNPDKIVVAPSHFLYPHIASHINANMPDWITIKIDLNVPYPDDMHNFTSICFDTQ